MHARKKSGGAFALLRRPLWLFLLLLALQTIPAGSLVARLRSRTSECPIPAAPETPAPSLPPDLRFTHLDRARAVARGLNYIYRTSLNRRNFAEYAGDYLWCFYTLSVAAHDEKLKQTARRMGLERALAWRRFHQTLPRNADAATIEDYVFASDAADNLNVRDDRLKEQIRQAAARYEARDYLLF